MTQYPIYAVGDIHGQIHMLDDILERIERDGGAAERVVFLGDYVDRGRDSRAVIETLIQGVDGGRPWTCIKGNHDLMFQRFFEDGTSADKHILSHKLWLHDRLGGDTTLASYMDTQAVLGDLGAPSTQLTDFGMDPLPDAVLGRFVQAVRDAIPERHRQFVTDLPRFHEEAGKLFVHAGIRPGLPMKWQDPDDLVWIRDEFLNDPRDHGALVVHGHTPVDTPDLRANRLNLDTGAGYGRPLTVAVFDEGQVFVLGPNGREAL